MDRFRRHGLLLRIWKAIWMVRVNLNESLKCSYPSYSTDLLPGNDFKALTTNWHGVQCLKNNSTQNNDCFFYVVSLYVSLHESSTSILSSKFDQLLSRLPGRLSPLTASSSLLCDSMFFLRYVMFFWPTWEAIRSISSASIVGTLPPEIGNMTWTSIL